MIGNIKQIGNTVCPNGIFCNYSKTLINNTHMSMNISKEDKISSISNNNYDNDENVLINIEDDLDTSKYIESYNPYNNFFFIIGKITFLQKNIRKFLNKKKAEKIENNKTDNEIISPTFANNNNKNHLTNITDSVSDISIIYKNFNKETKVNPEGETKENVNTKSTIKSYNDISFYTNSITLLNEDGSYHKDVRGNFLYKKKKYKFKGLVKNKRKDGFGRVIWEDGSRLWGIFENNRINGIAKFYDSSGNLFYGVYHENVPSGYGIFKKKKCYFEGEWYKIYLNGIGIELWNDDTFYEGEFSKFLKNGIGLYRWPDGTIYKGEWKDNNINGTGILSFNDGRLYEGSFVNGKMEGFGIFIWPDGKKYVGGYSNDEREGIGIYYVQKEPLIVYGGIWHNAKMNGIGFRLVNNIFYYSLWKNGKKIENLAGKWVYKQYLENKDIKYEKFYQLSDEQLLKYIKKYK